MNTEFVSRLLEYFKSNYGLEINDAVELFKAQRNLLEYLINLGREVDPHGQARGTISKIKLRLT